MDWGQEITVSNEVLAKMKVGGYTKNLRLKALSVERRAALIALENEAGTS
ncbi:MAG TPA: hypothetical protein VH107_15120 [Lacipirellulaceae bacterium]|jgi:hypothetical protein|nr:hypothetical protein [Lacipirellulaceae bacterium]